MADEKPVASQPAPARKPFPNIRYAVEFGDIKNRNFVFPLGSKPLRGRWATRNYLPNTTVHEKFQGMPDIPGIVLEVDATTRTVRFLDPLSDPRNKEALRIASAAYKTAFGEECCGWPEAKLENLSDDELKSYIYWTRRMMDNGSCKVINPGGKVPEMAEIEKYPGLVSFHNFDQGATIEHMKATPRRYLPPILDTAASGSSRVEFRVGEDGDYDE